MYLITDKGSKLRQLQLFGPSAQYFTGAHSPHIKGGPPTHMIWALLHLPFLLALLLLLRCVTNSLAATEAVIGAQVYVAIIDSIHATTSGLSASGVTVDEYIEVLKSTVGFPDFIAFASSVGVELERESAT